MKDERRIRRRPKKVLVIDVGGTHVKILMTGKRVMRKVNSGPTMTARKMVDAVKRLTEMGLETVLLTGDDHRTAEAVARQVSIAQVIAEVLPDGKVARNFLETWDAGDALGTQNNTDALILRELDARRSRLADRRH